MDTLICHMMTFEYLFSDLFPLAPAAIPNYSFKLTFLSFFQSIPISLMLLPLHLKAHVHVTKNSSVASKGKFMPP